MRTSVLGLGVPEAGDEGVGHHVLQSLAEHGVPPWVDLGQAANEDALVPMLETGSRVIVVDASVGTDLPGELLELDPETLAQADATWLLSHGMRALQALATARSRRMEPVGLDLRVVAITVDPPRAHHAGLTAPVAAAVPRAVKRVLDLVTASRRKPQPSVVTLLNPVSPSASPRQSHGAGSHGSLRRSS